MNPLLQQLLRDPETLKEFLQEGQRRFGDQTQAAIDQTELKELVRLRRKRLFGQQLAVVRDKSRKIVVQCTRQAGKSEVAAHMIGEATLRQPGRLVPYVALTKEQCHDIMWPKLEEFYDSVKIKAHFNSNTMRITLPNKSAIRMVGAEKPKEILKLLGPNYPLFVVDEGGAFGAHIEQLVKKVASPALMRQQGKLLLVGTPGEMAEGWFYDVTTGLEQGWAVHKWSFLENPGIKPEEKDLDKIARDLFGGDKNDPTFRREYLGEWVANNGSRVYEGYDPEISDWNGKLPVGDWLYGLGVDLGSKDGTTFIIVAFCLDDPNLYVLEEFKLTKPGNRHLTVSEVEEVTARLRTRYDFMRMVVDSGALGAMIVEEMRQRASLPFIAAEKQHKNDFIKQQNSDFRLGRIKIPKDFQLAGELSRLLWDTKLSVTGKRKEKPGMANDLCDALLYIYRESKHWAGKTPVIDQRPSDMTEVDWLERKRIDKQYELLENTNKDEQWLYE